VWEGIIIHCKKIIKVYYILDFLSSELQNVYLKLKYFSIANQRLLHPMLRTINTRVSKTNNSMKIETEKTRGPKPTPIRQISSLKISDYLPKPLNELLHRLQPIVDSLKTRRKTTTTNRTRPRPSKPEVAARLLRMKAKRKKEQIPMFLFRLFGFWNQPVFRFQWLLLLRCQWSGMQDPVMPTR
jgi:hypothetical protein